MYLFRKKYLFLLIVDTSTHTFQRPNKRHNHMFYGGTRKAKVTKNGQCLRNTLLNYIPLRFRLRMNFRPKLLVFVNTIFIYPLVEWWKMLTLQPPWIEIGWNFVVQLYQLGIRPNPSNHMFLEASIKNDSRRI